MELHYIAWNNFMTAAQSAGNETFGSFRVNPCHAPGWNEYIFT